MSATEHRDTDQGDALLQLAAIARRHGFWRDKTAPELVMVVEAFLKDMVASWVRVMKRPPHYWAISKVVEWAWDQWASGQTSSAEDLARVMNSAMARPALVSPAFAGTLLDHLIRHGYKDEKLNSWINGTLVGFYDVLTASVEKGSTIRLYGSGDADDNSESFRDRRAREIRKDDLITGYSLINRYFVSQNDGTFARMAGFDQEIAILTDIAFALRELLGIGHISDSDTPESIDDLLESIECYLGIAGGRDDETPAQDHADFSDLYGVIRQAVTTWFEVVNRHDYRAVYEEGVETMRNYLRRRALRLIVRDGDADVIGYRPVSADRVDDVAEQRAREEARTFAYFFHGFLPLGAALQASPLTY